jgi:hypothetical protein
MRKLQGRKGEVEKIDKAISALDVLLEFSAGELFLFVAPTNVLKSDQMLEFQVANFNEYESLVFCEGPRSPNFAFNEGRRHAIDIKMENPRHGLAAVDIFDFYDERIRPFCPALLSKDRSGINWGIYNPHAATDKISSVSVIDLSTPKLTTPIEYSRDKADSQPGKVSRR